MLQETMHLSGVRPIKVPEHGSWVCDHNLVLLQLSFGVIDDMSASPLDPHRV